MVPRRELVAVRAVSQAHLARRISSPIVREVGAVGGSGEAVPERVFLLRRGLFGYRRRDVLAALAEQHRQLEALAGSVDGLWREKERAWHANYAISTEMLHQKGRYEAQIQAERLRGAELEAQARVAAAETIARAEEQAAQIHSMAGEGFREVSRKLRDLLELRDELVRDVVLGLHGQSETLERWARRLDRGDAKQPPAGAQPELDAELTRRISDSAA
jgi:hypothetical protein